MANSTPLAPSRSALAARFYEEMWRMQTLETRLTQLSQSGELRGSLHLATGQEALPSGACAALRKDDAITVTYRGHGYVLAKGCDLNAVVAEIFGRRTGLCKGKGGKMHLTDIPNGLLGANGIVAGGIGTAVGAALASWMDDADRVAMTVFGDGTVNQGHAHEAFNMAGLWKLPIIFLCENNLYAEMTPLSRSTAVTELCEKMSGYGIDAVKIDGNDVFLVYETVSAAVEKARKGGGPTFIEAMTYRTCGHYQNDPGTSYRPKAEIADWRSQSPIQRLEAWCAANPGAPSAAELKVIQTRAEKDVEDALQAAMAAQYPQEAELMEDMFV